MENLARWAEWSSIGGTLIAVYLCYVLPYLGEWFGLSEEIYTLVKNISKILVIALIVVDAILFTCWVIPALY